MARETSASSEEEIRRLVDLAVQRDAEAFGQLYDLYLGPIYRYLFYRLGDAAEAEDLAEAVFLKAWEAIHRFRWQGKPFVAWLYRMAHNALIDYMRTRRPADSLDLHPDRAHPDREEELDRGVTAEEIAQAIGQLTEDQQQVVVLKFLEGLDNAEIAAITGKNEGAIRALQLRALLALRRALGWREL